MCEHCTEIGETFNYNAKVDIMSVSEAYLRSTLSFPCPVCGRGLQRPTYATLDATPDKTRFSCDTCESAGTRKQIENSAFYATHIAPRTCPLCGSKIRPAGDKMQDDWWMMRSYGMTWRCDGCSFVGKFSDFCDQHDRDTLPEHELVY